MSNPTPPSEIPDSQRTGGSAGSPPEILPSQHSELDVGMAAAFGERTGSGQNRDRTSTSVLAGTVIAERYKLIERIGEGGMGEVWYAEQLQPVKRKVAVKLIKPGMDSRAVIARFDAERQALALMDHPHIAKVLDGGMTEQERPYFVMELVRGTAITAFCDERRLNLHERLQLFIPVCQAIQHAHQKGIIHRDIKPSNVLVALYDDKPVPKVIDFGVAKAAGTTLTEHSLHTGFGAVVGTAEYMSPEQAQLNNVDIDTRSDIYSLGVLLYELLAGSPPFRRAELEAQGALEILRVVREVDPPRPSMKLSTSKTRASIAAVRNSDPKALGKLLRSDLDWIVMKSLEKDRARRYETANGLARDIERYLFDEPVEACPPNAGYRLRKFVRRNRSRVVAATLLLLTLVAGIIGTTYGLVRAEAARRVAEQAETATLESYRASTDDAIEQLIGSKPTLGPHERAYLQNTVRRWQAFADRKGQDERSRAIRGEGHFRVAQLWDILGQNADAQSEYERAIAIWERLVADFPATPMYQHEYAHSRRDLGLILQRLGNESAAEDQFRRAQEIQQKLVAKFPDVAKYRLELARNHETLGNLLDGVNKTPEAEEQLRKAAAILEKLVADFPDISDHRLSLATCHANLALALSNRAPSEAEDHYRRALLTFETLAEEFPSILIHRLGLAQCEKNLAELLTGQGKLAEAEGLFRKSLATLQSLVVEFPSVPVYQRHLAAGHSSLGTFLRDKLARTAEAEEQHRLALAIYKKLIANFPLIPEYHIELARVHFRLGYLLAYQGRITEGEAEHRNAIRIREELVTEFPTVPDYAVDLGASYYKLGELLGNSGKPEDSLVWFDKAIDTIRPVSGVDPRSGLGMEPLRESFLSRAKALALLHRDSKADWEKVLEFFPTDGPPQTRIKRARVQLQAGQLAAAVACVDELTASAVDSSNAHPWGVVEWYDAACFYSVASRKSLDHQTEYADRGMELLKEAVKSGFKDAVHIQQDPDMDPLRDRDDFKQLLEDLSRDSAAGQDGMDPHKDRVRPRQIAGSRAASDERTVSSTTTRMCRLS